MSTAGSMANVITGDKIHKTFISDKGVATRALDNGALGIVMPHVDTAAEAREVEQRLLAEQERVEHESIEVRYDLDERTRRQMQAYEARRSARVPQSSHQYPR